MHAAMPPDHHIFQNGHVLEQPDVLECARHPFGGHLIRFEPVQALCFSLARKQVDIPLCGIVDARNAVEQGGFAGTVGSDQRHDLALIHRHVDAVQSPQTAKIHGQLVNVQHPFRRTSCFHSSRSVPQICRFCERH
jgi:hypothetical protein